MQILRSDINDRLANVHDLVLVQAPEHTHDMTLYLLLTACKVIHESN